RYPAVLELVRDADTQGKVVGAICHAGWVLCSARIVKGRTVTSVPAIKDDLINAGANWVDREVVRDGRLVTSRPPADLPAFRRTLIATMSEVPAAVRSEERRVGKECGYRCRRCHEIQRDQERCR